MSDAYDFRKTDKAILDRLEKRQFPSSSRPGVEYTTLYDPETGQVSCDCRGWTVKRGDKPRECTHTKEVLATKAGAKPSKTVGRVSAAGAPPRPMLASPMKEDQTLADFSGPEWVMEQKFDGHRITLVVTGLEGDKVVTGWARGGADRPQLQRELPAGIIRDAQHLPFGIYDGELCVPGGTSSDVTRLDLQDKLVLILFDALEILGQDLKGRPGTERRAALELAVAHVPKDAPNYVQVASQSPVSRETVEAIWAAGGEGAILKKKDATYRPGWRSPYWVKVKAIGSAELTLVAFEAGKMGPQSVMRLRHDDGRETTVKVLGNEWLRVFDRAAALNEIQTKFIGKRVTISFMGMTSGNVWRHPQFDHFVEEV